jgi:hypothetical protein
VGAVHPELVTFGCGGAAEKTFDDGAACVSRNFQLFAGSTLCGLPRVPLAKGLVGRRVLLWYTYREWIMVAVASARIGVVVGGVVVVGLRVGVSASEPT